MRFKVATTKRLIKEVFQNLIISERACIILSHEAEEYVLNIIRKAQEILESDNELRAINRLKPLRRITEDHIQRAIRGDGNAH